ncbi:MAG: cation:proton antiporter [Actinomycetota bacterium]|nr:cation:proton antiporter [Actinomycetota bacterium]
MTMSIAITDGGGGASATLIALAVIVLTAVVCGRVAQKVGQPKVLGEMVGGVLLGPSVFGALAPKIQGGIFTPEVAPILSGLGEVGLTLYMFLVGVRFDHGRASHGSRALPFAAVAAGSLAPIAFGATAAYLFALGELPTGISQFQYVLFVGGALSVTAFPMLASMLEERRMSSARFGSLATFIAAGDDAIAWCFLALIVSMGAGTYDSGLLTLGLTAVFIAACALFIPRLLRRVIARTSEAQNMSDAVLGLLVVIALTAGSITNLIGVYSVFGASVAGAFVPYDSRFAELARVRLMVPVGAIFLPVFFSSSGLKTDLGAVLSTDALSVLGVLLFVGFASKLLPVYGVMRAFGWARGPSLAMGGLMNARGLMILIFIGVGSELGILNDVMFSSFVVVAILTTATAMPLYRTHFKNDVEEEERQRSEPHIDVTPRT